MKTEIVGNLIRSGFSFISKTGLHLFINCKDRKVNLNSTCHDDGKVTFWFNDDRELYPETQGEITFHCETELERELLKDTQRFDCQCKDRFEFLFVKFNDLMELEA